jgi:cytochrome c biogenesis protein CcdA
VLTEASPKLIEVTAGVLGLGLLDSLNPFSIAAMALVLTGTRPLVLGGTFIATTFVIYAAAGFATFAGWTAVLTKLIPLIPAWVIEGGLALLGVGCLAAAWYMWTKNDGASSKIADMVRTTVLGTALYAASSTISDVPTALPYFAAIHLLAEADLAVFSTGALLVLYNLSYVAPLGLLLAIRLKGGDKVDATFNAIRTCVDWGFKNIVPPLTACLGLYCLGVVGISWLQST